MGACHRAPKQVTALAVHGPRKACGRAGRGLDRCRGAAALGSRPSARPGEGRSTGCLSPLPSLFHLRPRPQGPGPIALVEQDARDGQRRRTRPPSQTGHRACATDGGQRPSGPSRPSGARRPWVSLRPWEAAALTADVTDEREKGPSSLGPRGPRETPGRVPSQCPASSRCRAASEAGPPDGREPRLQPLTQARAPWHPSLWHSGSK